MATNLRNPRLIAYQQLLSRLASGFPVWTDFLGRLPLTLGESAADRVVPYSVSDDVQVRFSAAVDGLVDLLKRRRDPAYDREGQAALLPEGQRRVVLWPKRICPRTLPDDDPARGVVRNALVETPDLDGGLLESWLSRGAGGRELFDLLTALLAKAFETAFSHPAFSGVGLLAHLATLNSLLLTKDRIKQAKVRNTSYGRLERAIGMGLHACFRQAFDSAVIQAGRPPAGTPEHTDLMICLVSLGPLPFFSIQSAELTEDINPYGLSAEVDELLMPLYQAGLEHGNQPSLLLSEMLSQAHRPGPLRTSLLQLAGCEAFRRLALDHLMANEDSALESDQLLSYCYASNAGVLELMENSPVLSQMATELNSRLVDSRRQRGTWRELQRLTQMVERLRDQGPAWKKPEETDELALQELVERFLLHRLDEFSESHISLARRRVVDRRPSSTATALRQEYQAGRLYRIADDEQPLVQVRAVLEEAQLFVDLKGYTRRTASAKELVMADFLKREFYQPILEAATLYHGGASLVTKDQNIELVNLLGDAVAFSGNVVSLVNLARDIQGIFRTYSEKLDSLATGFDDEALRQAENQAAKRREVIRVEQAMLDGKLQEIKQQVFERAGLSAGDMVRQLQQDYSIKFDKLKASFEELSRREQAATDRSQRAQINARVTALRQAYDKLRNHREQTLARLKTLKGEVLVKTLTNLLSGHLLDQVRRTEERIRALKDEERTLVEAEREERHRHGAGLEAGLFIAYGSAAEVITLEDDVWGLQRVAVSERINEAARGTARNTLVRQRLDEKLEAARHQRRRPDLDLPFRVYVASTGTFRVDPKLGRMWQKAMDEHDRELFERFMDRLHESVRARFSEDRTRPGETSAIQGNDIYNLGEALSAGALDAYLRRTRNTHMFFRVQVRPDELAPQIHDRFLFLEEMLSLILGSDLKAEGETVEMYRYVGQVLFRGFEGTRPTPVYEILRPSSPFFRMIREHHLEDWLTEARQDPTCRLEGLFVEGDPDPC